MLDIAVSVEGVPVRLIQEPWFHIIENHNDLAGYYNDVLDIVEHPELVLRGYRGVLIAVRSYGRKGYLQVMYRQISQHDGFIITAYFSSKIDRKKVARQC
jgi:hypothetical protein